MSADLPCPSRQGEDGDPSSSLILICPLLADHPPLRGQTVVRIQIGSLNFLDTSGIGLRSWNSPWGRGVPWTLSGWALALEEWMGLERAVSMPVRSLEA